MTLKTAALVLSGFLLSLGARPSWTSSGDDALGATFGAVVASAGDVNGDGFDDLIVGAPLFSGAGLESGKVYVYFGSRHGLSRTPGWTATGSGQGFAQFGAGVASAGDVNGDGYADLLVGEPTSATRTASSGRRTCTSAAPRGLRPSPPGPPRATTRTARSSDSACRPPAT
jgi:hypothetical protein